jgi:hypothetical protein
MHQQPPQAPWAPNSFSKSIQFAKVSGLTQISLLKQNV